MPEWEGREHAAAGGDAREGQGSEVRVCLPVPRTIPAIVPRSTPRGRTRPTLKRGRGPRSRLRTHRDVTYVYKEMNSVGLQYGPKFSMLQDVYMTPEAALH